MARAQLPASGRPPSQADIRGWPPPFNPQPQGERRLWLKGQPATPAEEKTEDEAGQAPETRPHESPLCCARCGHVITHERHRTTLHGRHTHTRLNPAGVVFHFGCFAQAEGCLVVGPPTAEASWFPGHVWEFAFCGACQTHLGWAFHGESDFFGLVLDRLTAPS